MSELDKVVSKDEVPIPIGWLRRQNLVRMEKSGGETVITLTEQGRSFLGAEMEDEKVLRTLMAGQARGRASSGGPAAAEGQARPHGGEAGRYVTDMDRLRQSPIF